MAEREVYVYLWKFKHIKKFVGPENIALNSFRGLQSIVFGKTESFHVFRVVRYVRRNVNDGNNRDVTSAALCAETKNFPLSRDAQTARPLCPLIPFNFRRMIEKTGSNANFQLIANENEIAQIRLRIRATHLQNRSRRKLELTLFKLELKKRIEQTQLAALIGLLICYCQLFKNLSQRTKVSHQLYINIRS